jgi:hypothetical protein
MHGVSRFSAWHERGRESAPKGGLPHGGRPTGCESSSKLPPMDVQWPNMIDPAYGDMRQYMWGFKNGQTAGGGSGRGAAIFRFI